MQLKLTEHQILPINLNRNAFFGIIKEMESIGIDVRYYEINYEYPRSFSEIECLLIKSLNNTDYSRGRNARVNVAIYNENKYSYTLCHDIRPIHVYVNIPFEIVHKIYSKKIGESTSFKKRNFYLSKLPRFYTADKAWDVDFKVELFRYAIDINISHPFNEKYIILFEYEPTLSNKGRVCARISDIQDDLKYAIISQFLGFTDLL